ncbi:MAG: SEC-C domain-containing protein [Flavobacteriales bacterium]|nr:SEC-C domain-containing protein [Flavobacteriales bacterium]
MTEQCPCGTGKDYQDCCSVFHKDITKVQTAEQLMRSRYTAFVKANGDYLMTSQHSATRPSAQKYEIVRWAMSVKWLKLEIEKVINGNMDDEEGEVIFNAFYMERFQNRRLHEHSKFVKENGHWVYWGAL